MSFFDTPGTDGYNSFTREEAINLLLASVAQEEDGLSKLMDAERNKLLYTINRYRHGKCDLRNVLEINKSVDGTIKNMIKYQMLLQHKLENIKELIASYPAESKPPVNAAHFHRGTAAVKCKPQAAPESSKVCRPSPENPATKETDPACSANPGSVPKRPHQKCTAAVHYRSGAAAAKCKPSAAQTSSKGCPPPEGSASAGTDPVYLTNTVFPQKNPHHKCMAAHTGPNRPAQKPSAPKAPDHPVPKSSAPNNPANIKKRCGRRPSPCNRKPVINSACHLADVKKTAECGACNHKPVMNRARDPARKKAVSRQTAMLRALLFCFLPFRFF